MAKNESSVGGGLSWPYVDQALCIFLFWVVEFATLTLKDGKTVYQVMKPERVNQVLQEVGCVM